MIKEIFFRKHGDFSFMAMMQGFSSLGKTEIISVLFFKDIAEVTNWMENEVSKNELKKWKVFSLTEIIK